MATIKPVLTHRVTKFSKRAQKRKGVNGALYVDLK